MGTLNNFTNPFQMPVEQNPGSPQAQTLLPWQGQSFAPPPQPQGTVQGILSSRQPAQTNPLDLLQAINQISQPSGQDIGNAAIARFSQKNPGITAENMTQQRLAPGLAILKELSTANLENARANAFMSGGGLNGGGATMIAARQIQAENPDIPFLTAFSIAKSGLGQGNTWENGGVSNMQGAPQAAGGMSYGKELGTQNAKIDTAAGIERQKKIGQGEITDVQQYQQGKQQVSQVIGDLGKAYDALDKAGGAVNTQNGSAANTMAYFGNTQAGQTIGKMTGSQNQSTRNSIAQMRPLLINAIRRATGMSAKAMDSNAELSFYLKAATDPTLDIQANKQALQRLEQVYGLSAPGIDQGQLAVGTNPSNNLSQMQTTGNNTLPGGQPDNRAAEVFSPDTSQPSLATGRISIITPDGKPGTIDASHLQDLISAGGKVAQ